MEDSEFQSPFDKACALLFPDMPKWMDMRARLLDGLKETRQEHLAEIVEEFEQNQEIQSELAKYATDQAEIEYDKVVGYMLAQFSDDWLIRHGYAFLDDVQGVLPIKWKDIPRDQWGEVPSPFAQQ